MIVLGDIPRKYARLEPGKECLVCEDTRLTWKELNDRVNRLANGLAELGAGKDTKVAVLAINCHRYVEAYYALAKLGAVAVPLNLRLTPEELTYVIDNSEAEMLMVGPAFVEVAGEILPGLERVNHTISFEAPREGWIGYEELVERSSGAEPEAEVDEDDLCHILYTGGTTGLPRGAMISHRSYITLAIAVTLPYGIDTDGAALQILPLFHLAWWPTLMAHFGGAKAVMVKRLDFDEILSMIERERITGLCMVPVLFNWLLDFPDLDKYDLSSMKVYVYGGAPMPADLLRRCFDRFGPKFTQAYGLTECVVGCGLYEEDHVVDGPPELTRRLSSCGRETALSEFRVVDENDEEVAVGEIGEMVTRGKGVMKGYWKNPELTAEVMRGGWLHTGDMARVDEDGYIYIVDRKNDMIITGGENVYPFEVEKVLYEHPAVLEAGVVGLQEPKWGEMVTAVVSLKQGEQATEEELIAFAKERLAGYKCPKKVVIMAELPKTPIGKVLRREVREMLQAQSAE